MAKDDISYKDLSKNQLDDLKDLYIDERVKTMTPEDLTKFVRTIITDQIKGTVGNQEEREAWREIKDFYKDDFESKIKEVLKNRSSRDDTLPPEKEELEKRLELLEKRKKEKSNSNEDMW
tara:strand:- start:58 stop:417 length:360 start_codon:yes stop_codon:yes gene_type:complete